MEHKKIRHNDIYYDTKKSQTQNKIYPINMITGSVIREFIKSHNQNQERAYDIFLILDSCVQGYEVWYKIAQQMNPGFFFERVCEHILAPNNTSIESLRFVIEHTQLAWLKDQATTKIKEIKQDGVILKNKKDNKKSLRHIA